MNATKRRLLIDPRLASGSQLYTLSNGKHNEFYLHSGDITRLRPKMIRLLNQQLWRVTWDNQTRTYVSPGS